MKVFNGIEDVIAAEGSDLGTTDWMEIEQQRVNQFADATGDHQWIHVDTERAKDGPFGATIAHGFLTLSMLPVLQQQLYRVDGITMAVNYGLNKVRFAAPVLVGAKVRASVAITKVTPLDGAIQAEFTTTIEVEGSAKPACIVESIARYVA
ncbi:MULTISPECIES: MaoC family dehydratase [Rhodococcus]|jgi:acyl dehydratase|uniref:MaoC family dehydratase n=1 Tax=Rhodococcus qingshengii JCM 15477 TaxID=1303681 RepID=A0AB38RNB4_RHOSG|nr:MULTISPECIES: MaoC family dehydratase [Rhodococcus]ANQ75851.1 dehydratase [Rhodococcus sp. 008]KSU69281.1 dehydratase [Rhodococcus qingshengii]MDA3635226.1 MaoC family dehydratase [Rhodococcus sp. C-2]UPU46860.1 MaoC family dehydratase [Rhodococcus qingshengii JCM 15477]SCC66535.1 Acyl dehydratase [Rhodococcus qingshengii]